MGPARALAWLAAACLGASMLGGCVSEGTYEQSVLDARAARSEAARRDALLAQLQAQTLAINERLQLEMARQNETQQLLLLQMEHLREAEASARAGAKPATKGERAAETLALQQRVRQLEEQQRQAVGRAEALQTELTRLQSTRPRVIRTTNGRSPVTIDTENPWY